MLDVAAGVWYIGVQLTLRRLFPEALFACFRLTNSLQLLQAGGSCCGLLAESLLHVIQESLLHVTGYVCHLHLHKWASIISSCCNSNVQISGTDLRSVRRGDTEPILHFGISRTAYHRDSTTLNISYFKKPMGRSWSPRLTCFSVEPSDGDRHCSRQLRPPC